MKKQKQPKRSFPAQVDTALEGVRLERQPDATESGASGHPIPRRQTRKPSREDMELVEKLIRALESI